MYKIDNIKDFDGNNTTIEILKEEYYISLLTGRANYISPIVKLNNLLNTYRKDKKRQEVIKYCIDNFETIIKSEPSKLQEIITYFESKNYINLLFNLKTEKGRNFSKNIIKAFRYEDFRSSKLLNLAKRLNIKVCPYCNSQYTLYIEDTVNNKQLAKFQFDHFYRKDKYPFLCLSFYNLIPACASCNLKKGNKEFSIEDYAHPYVESFGHLTKFVIGEEEELKLLMGENLKLDRISIKMTNRTSNKKVENHNLVFDLEDIYGRHKDIVKEIYVKAYAYNDSKKKELLTWKDSNGNPFFKSLEELNKYILCNYISFDEINKRPLSKFMQDIAKGAGLIK